MPKDNKKPVNGIGSNSKSSDQNLKMYAQAILSPPKGSTYVHF